MIKNKKKALIISITTFVIVAFIGVCVFYSDISKIGESFGDVVGTAVGALKGSYTGFTEGRKKGKEEGQSAKDTEVDLDSIKSIGKLEVLEVNFTEYNAFSSGGKSEDNENYVVVNPDYAILYKKTGKAVYTVDLGLMDIVENEKNPERLDITLPRIEVTPRIDDSTLERVDTYEKNDFIGSTKDGTVGFDNSTKELEKKIEDTFNNDQTLKESAYESARKQVTSIVEALTNKKVNSIYIEGEDE